MAKMVIYCRAYKNRILREVAAGPPGTLQKVADWEGVHPQTIRRWRREAPPTKATEEMAAFEPSGNSGQLGWWQRFKLFLQTKLF